MSISILIFLSVAIHHEVLAQDTLIKLSVLFRHGARMPIASSYPNDPYKNTPLRLPHELLTEKGAQDAIELGDKLRKQYDSFLGNYEPSQYRAISSPSIRCIETLTNLTTSLYPEHKHRLPYTYAENDKLIAVHKTCPRILRLLSEIELDSEHDRQLASIVGEIIGKEIKTYFQFLELYDYLNVMEENDYPRPIWARALWYELFTMYKKGWNLMIQNEGMNAAGNLLHKIASESIGHKLNVFPKVNLYSGHDMNIVTVLGLLEGYKNQDIHYCSYIAFEVYQTPNNTNYVQVYLDNQDVRRELIPIPGCDEKCPVEKFLEHAESKYLAEEWCK